MAVLESVSGITLMISGGSGAAIRHKTTIFRQERSTKGRRGNPPYRPCFQGSSMFLDMVLPALHGCFLGG